ncbi:MAG: hypothetical protein ACREQA_04640 [Candidatus Binatia bacterium]
MNLITAIQLGHMIFGHDLHRLSLTDTWIFTTFTPSSPAAIDWISSLDPSGEALLHHADVPVSFILKKQIRPINFL